MSKKVFEPFPCGECGTSVGMHPATGEVWEFTRGISVKIPVGTPLPKCLTCGTTYFAPEDEKRVTALVRKAYLKAQSAHWTRLLDELKGKTGLSLREIEIACRKAPTYFSHLVNGKKVASISLTLLLESFVANPQELLRNHRGEPFKLPTAATKEPGTSNREAMMKGRFAGVETSWNDGRRVGRYSGGLPPALPAANTSAPAKVVA